MLTRSTKSFTTINNYDGKDESTKPTKFSPLLDNKFEDIPSPLNFDEFVPFIAREMGLHVTATVTRIVQEDYIPIFSSRKKSKPFKKTTEVSNEKAEVPSSDVQKIENVSSEVKNNINEFKDVVVPIKAFYDTRGRLVEICISGSNHITQKLIKAINLCLQFHTGLNKLSIINSRVKQDVIYEIGQLLPFAHITDVCLDHTYVRQGNFYILLDNCRLKRLSLNRCRINDIILEEIANRIDFNGAASENLQILELSTNFITDLGVYLLGSALRMNRKLLHLNLAGNCITDKGAIFLLEQLMTFHLTEAETIDKTQRKLSYYKRWKKVFDRTYQEELKKQQKIEEMRTLTTRRKSSVANPKLKQAKRKQVDVAARIKTMAEEVAHKLLDGPFKDVFDDNHIIYKNGTSYCTGNLILCSLNLCYNDLTFFSVKKVLEVVKYQHSISKRPEESGLLKIVLEGNFIPRACMELEWIDIYLKKAVYDRSPPDRERRKMSVIGFST